MLETDAENLYAYQDCDLLRCIRVLLMELRPPNQTEQERRLSDARHDYNNIAAIVAMTRNPTFLAQARAQLLALREQYPEYVDDPDGLNEILGLDSR